MRHDVSAVDLVSKKSKNVSRQLDREPTHNICNTANLEYKGDMHIVFIRVSKGWFSFGSDDNILETGALLGFHLSAGTFAVT